MDIKTHRRERLIWQVKHSLELKKQSKLQVEQWEHDYPGQRIEGAANRLEALPGKQQRLMGALRFFLVVTLIILGAAVVGFVHFEWLKNWEWTPTLLYAASALLAFSPAIVVWWAALRDT